MVDKFTWESKMVLKGYNTMDPIYYDISKYFKKKMWEWQAGDGTKTQLEFAEYLGVEEGTLNKWINGERRPNIENVELLAKKLDMKLYDLLGLLRPDPDLEEIVEYWDDLDKAAKKDLIELARKRKK